MLQVKQMLRARGYSVAGVARRYGIKVDQLNNVLNDKILPPHEVRVALSDALGMPVTEVFPEDVLARVYRLPPVTAA